MNKIYISSIAVLLSMSLQASLLERFDDENVVGKISNGSIIESDQGLEKGALTAKGKNIPVQYIYVYTQKLENNAEYVVGMNYKMNDVCKTSPLLLQIILSDSTGKKKPEVLYFRQPRSLVWTHVLQEFTAKEGFDQAKISLRLVSAPEDAKIWVDHFRVGKVDADGLSKGIKIENFETTFDSWFFDKHLIFDHFMLGPGGAIINEWKEAKVGEAFFKAVGDSSPMQYALYIKNISVKGNSNYIFEAWLNASESFKFNGNGILIFFYKDAEGKAVGQSRYHIRPTGNDWKEFAHSFTVPSNCTTVDIGLNLRNMSDKEFVKLDHIRFKKGEDTLYLKYEIDSDKKVMNFSNLITGNINKDEMIRNEFIIADASGKTIKTIESLPEKTESLDLSVMPDGEYSLLSRCIFKDNKVLESTKRTFGVFNNPSWLNEIGVVKPSDNAPEPWENLKLTDSTVTTWNNQIKFSNSLDLQSIAGAGQDEYLQSPMILNIDGQNLFEKASKAVWSYGKSLIVAQSKFSLNNLSGTIDLSVNYWGFSRYKITLEADKECEVNSALLTMQLNNVEFIHRSDGSWTDTGSVDLRKVEKFSSKNFGQLQFGNIDSGISFYAEKLYPAIPSFEKEWLNASLDGTLKIELINAPLKLKKAEKYTFDFAIAPYPFRPAQELWRKVRFRAGKNSNCDLLWQTAPFLKYAGSLPQMSDEAAAKKYLERKAPIQLLYQCPTYIMETLPQWSYFSKKWRAFPSRSYDFTESHGGMMYKGNYRERSWVDLYIKTMADELKKYRFDGVYYDVFTADWFTDAGESSLPVFANMNFHERIYNTQRLHNKDSLTVSHLGAEQGNTLAAYSNIILMGEQYRAKFLKHRYFLDFLTLDEFRLENAVNVGADRMILPQYRKDEDINSSELTNHVMGMAMIHNLMIYPNFIRKDIELRFRDRQYEFGMDNAAFFPYWKSNSYQLKTDNPAVVLSFYKKQDKVFAIVLNSSKVAQKFKVTADLPIQNGTFYQPIDDTTTPLTPDTILELPPYLAGIITFSEIPLQDGAAVVDLKRNDYIALRINY